MEEEEEVVVVVGASRKVRGKCRRGRREVGARGGKED